MKVENIILRSCYWLIILMPILITAGRGVGDTGLSLVAILFLLLMLLKRELKPFQENWFVIFATFWCYAVIRSLFADDVSLALHKSLPIIRLALFALCFQYFASEKPEMSKKILYVLFISLGFLVVDGYIQFFTGTDIFGKPKLDVGNYYRLTGPFPKMVLGNMISVLSFPLVAYCINQALHHKKHVLPYTIFCFALYFIVMLSGERSALIQVTTCTIIVLFILHKDPRKMILYSIPVFLLIASLLYFVGGYELIHRQFISIVDSIRNFSSNQYGKLWIASINIFFNHWVFGVGPMHFEEYCKPISDFCNYHPHHIYLELLTETGITGFAIFSSMMYVILKPTFHNKKAHDLLHIVALSATIFVIVKFLPFIPHTGLFKNWYAVPLWFLIGWLLHANAVIRKR